MKFLLLITLLINVSYAKIIELSLDDKNKTGLIVFDINRDIDLVMKDILNLEAYPQNIEDVKKLTIYESSRNKIKAQIHISTFFIDFDNNVIHDIDKKNYTITWHLDGSKKNYFLVMQGSWKLKKIKEGTRVYYKNHLEFKTWVPGFFESYLLKKGILKSTQWLDK